MASTAQTNPNCRSIEVIFLDLSTFLKDRVKQYKHENLKNILVNEGVNTCNIAENLAHQTKLRIGGNITMTIPSTL